MFDGIENKKPADTSGRPENIPEKFWDAEKKEPRVDAMAKSYSELEQRLAQGGKVPDSYEGVPDNLHEELRENKFTQEQAKWVNEKLSSVAQEQAIREATAEKARLAAAWGTENNPLETQQRLEAVFRYASERLGSPEAAKIMTTTSAQVLTLESLMKSEMERGRAFEGHPSSPKVHTRESLRARMADPRYNVDAEYTQSVQEDYARFEEQNKR